MPRIQGALISCGGGRLSRSTRSGKSNPLPVPAPIPPIPPTLTGRSRCIGRGALPRYMGGGGGRSRSKRDRSRSWRCQSLANSRGLSGSPLRCIKCNKDKERRNWGRVPDAFSARSTREKKKKSKTKETWATKWSQSPISVIIYFPPYVQLWGHCIICSSGLPLSISRMSNRPPMSIRARNF